MNRHARSIVLVALGVAVAAMIALHVVQPALDPFAEPVSFYVHGTHGWLVSVALGTFGLASVGLARARPPSFPARSRRSLAGFGWGMIVTAIVPSDSWFPWESAPTIHGLVHATAAMLAPLLLLDPMAVSSRFHKNAAALLVLYFMGLIASAAALAVGFFRDQAPPLVGIAERVLAFAAVTWIATEARRETPGRGNSPTAKD